MKSVELSFKYLYLASLLDHNLAGKDPVLYSICHSAVLDECTYTEGGRQILLDALHVIQLHSESTQITKTLHLQYMNCAIQRC